MVLRPDPECEALQGKIAEVEDKIVQLSARQAEMENSLQDFRLAQYRALGESLAECLRLRHEVAARRAELSGDERDADAAQRAAGQQRDYRRALEEVPRAEIDAETRDELKRLYRSAAMRCHPDRVAEQHKADAQARFQRALKAYREGDLAALRQLLREIDASPLAAAGALPEQGAAVLKKTLSALRTKAADLILAIQTLQIEPDYRRARDPQGWQDYFDEARRGFEIECEELRRMLEALQQAG